MEIIHFGKFYPPDNGGIESITRTLANGAANSGRLVKVVCFAGRKEIDADLPRDVQIERFTVRATLASQPLSLGYIFKCISYARQAKCIHLHAPNILAMFCVLFASKHPKVLVHWHSDVINKGFFGKLVKPLEKSVLKRADVIVATSDNYSRASSALGSFRDKIEVIPLGIENAGAGIVGTEEKRISPACTVNKDETCNEAAVILAVGRLVPYKGFHNLIEAAKHLPENVSVNIVGSGPLESTLRSAIRSNGVEKKVKLIGSLSSSSLESSFKEAQVFCLPSVHRAEAFGVALIEAMSFGLPVVTCDIEGSGVPWVNEHEVTGLNVTPNNPIELAEALTKLVTNDSLRGKYAAAARQRYLKEFTEELFVERFNALYENLGC